MPPEKEEYYEIVPTEPFSERETKKEHIELEREIEELKKKIKSTTGIAKYSEETEKFMGKIVELLTNSQKLVTEVAETNKDLASKIQTALDTMNKTNKVLSEKLTKILDYFAKAGEIEEEVSPDILEPINQIQESLNNLIKETKRTNQLLQLIEKDLKRKIIKRGVPDVPTKLTKPGLPPPVPPVTQTGAPPLKEGELPPPPFPP